MRVGPKKAATALLLLVLAHPVVSRAGPYEDGDAAFHLKNYEVAMKHWHPVAAAGHADAQLGIATLYYGGLGVGIDYSQAFDWCTKAAEQGLPQAQYMLAAMYRDGKGAAQDNPKAFALFRKAADQDVQGAQYSLGLMYLTGEGTPVDSAEAYYWLSLAADAQGRNTAQLRATASYLRDQAAAKLSPEQVAEVKQRIANRKSAAR
jgi:uncharacterized protein